MLSVVIVDDGSAGILVQAPITTIEATIAAKPMIRLFDLVARPTPLACTTESSEDAITGTRTPLVHNVRE